MTKYNKYKKILENIKTVTNFDPLNEAGCEMCFDLIQQAILKAKRIKAGYDEEVE